MIVGSLEDDKAEDVVALDLAGKAAFCDRMVIATGLADRQITAMATHLEERLHDERACRASPSRVPAAPIGCCSTRATSSSTCSSPRRGRCMRSRQMWGADLDEAV